MRYYILAILSFVCISASAQGDRQCIREGNKLYRQKDYAKAEVQYRKALVKNPENSQALYNLGCALMMQQKDSAAVVQYEKAAKAERTKLRKSKSYHNMGVVCQTHKMYDEAIKAYEQSLRLNPKDDETRYNLALCKKLRKNQPQQDKNQSQDNKKDDNGKDEKQEKQQKQDDKKDENKQKQQEQQMSKDNAEQLLNAAIQSEKATKQKLDKNMQKPRSRNIQKNW